MKPLVYIRKEKNMRDSAMQGPAVAGICQKMDSGSTQLDVVPGGGGITGVGAVEVMMVKVSHRVTELDVQKRGEDVAHVERQESRAASWSSRDWGNTAYLQ
jgi:hypothetical protein